MSNKDYEVQAQATYGDDKSRRAIGGVSLDTTVRELVEGYSDYDEDMGMERYPQNCLVVRDKENGEIMRILKSKVIEIQVADLRKESD